MPDADAATRLRMASALVDIGRAREAVAMIRGLLASNPQDAAALKALGWALIDLDTPAMLDAADAAVSAAPHDAQAHHLRSIALRKLDRLDEALRAGEQTLALDSSRWEHHYTLARTLKECAVRELSAAKVQSRGLAPRKPTWMSQPTRPTLKGAVGRLADAYRVAVRAQASAPLEPSTFWLLADILEVAGEFRAARGEYLAGLALDPQNDALRAGLAYLDNLTRHHRAAAVTCQALVMEAPLDAGRRRQLAHSLRLLRRVYALWAGVVVVPAAAVARALADSAQPPLVGLLVVATLLTGAYTTGLFVVHRGIRRKSAQLTRDTALVLALPVVCVVGLTLAPLEWEAPWVGFGFFTVYTEIMILGDIVGAASPFPRWAVRRSFRRALGGPPATPRVAVRQ